MWSEILGIGAFPLAVWISGAYDKYPELMFPLFIIYMAIVGPSLTPSEFSRKWKALEKRRMKAVKANNEEEEIKAEEEREKLELYNIPLTLGHLNTLRAELEERFRTLNSELCSMNERLKREPD